MKLHVRGIGFWATGFPDMTAFQAAKPDPDVVKPACSIAKSRLMRGTSLLTRMVVEAAAQAGEDARIDMREAAVVFGSAFGETQIAIDQLSMMRTGDGIVSPARFKNSVHNTGAGVFSIATSNRNFVSALAGGWETTASVLLEAAGLLQDQYEHVVVAVADEPIPEAMDSNFVFHGAGVAFVVSRKAAKNDYGSLIDLRITDKSDRKSSLPEALEKNPIAPAIDLANQLFRRKTGPVSLTHRGTTQWLVDVGEPA